MRRRIVDALVSVTSLTIVLLAIYAADDRVREQVQNQLRGDGTTQVVGVAHRARAAGYVFLETARAQAESHRPLTIFVIAAGVLTLFMFRM